MTFLSLKNGIYKMKHNDNRLEMKTEFSETINQLRPNMNVRPTTSNCKIFLDLELNTIFVIELTRVDFNSYSP